MNSMLSMAGFISPSNVGPMQMVIVLAIVLIIFGPKKLPGLGRAMGKSIREFRDSMKGLTNALDEDEDDGPVARTGDLDPKPVERSDKSNDKKVSAN